MHRSKPRRSHQTRKESPGSTLKFPLLSETVGGLNANGIKTLMIQTYSWISIMQGEPSQTS